MHPGATPSANHTAERAAPTTSAAADNSNVFIREKAGSVTAKAASPASVKPASEESVGDQGNYRQFDVTAPKAYTSPPKGDEDDDSVLLSVSDSAESSTSTLHRVAMSAGARESPGAPAQSASRASSLRGQPPNASHQGSFEGVTAPQESVGGQHRVFDLNGTEPDSEMDDHHSERQASEVYEDRLSERSGVTGDASGDDENVATLSSLNRETVEALIKRQPSYDVVKDTLVFPAAQLIQPASSIHSDERSQPGGMAVDYMDDPSDRRSRSSSGLDEQIASRESVEAAITGQSVAIEHWDKALDVGMVPDLASPVDVGDDTLPGPPADWSEKPIISRPVDATVVSSGTESVASSEVSVPVRSAKVEASRVLEVINKMVELPDTEMAGIRDDVEGVYDEMAEEAAPMAVPVAPETPSKREKRNVFIDIGTDYRDSVENPNLVSVQGTPMNVGTDDVEASPSYTKELPSQVADNAAVTLGVGDRVTAHEAPSFLAASQGDEEYSLTKQLTKEVDYYKQLSAQLESKVADIWNQREAFRVASDRMAENLVRHSSGKSVRFETQLRTDSEDDLFVDLQKPGRVVGRGATRSLSSRGLSQRGAGVDIGAGHGGDAGDISAFTSEDTLPPMRMHSEPPHGVPRGIKCNRQTMERLLSCGAKLYAFQLSNAGTRSREPLFIDVCPPQSAYGGKVILSNEVGLFKVSLVKPPAESPSSVGSMMLNYFGLDACRVSGSLYGLFNSFADYVGLSWMGGASSGGSSQCLSARRTDPVQSLADDGSPPHVQIKYMHSLVKCGGSVEIAGDSFPSNCNIGAVIHNRQEHLFCVEETRELKKADLRGNFRFTFILNTTPSTKPRRPGSRRFNSNVYLVNSLTREYLCVDLLTHELHFAGGQHSRAYSKYVVPASFKMVPLYKVVMESSPSPSSAVSEAVHSAYYRRCVTERAAFRHGYDLPRGSRHMVDEHGNFAPPTQAAGTPAPSPRRRDSDISYAPSLKHCVLRDSLSARVADTYDIQEHSGRGTPRAAGSRGVEAMYNMLGAPDEPVRIQEAVSALQRGPGVKDLRMKFERLSGRRAA
ncbi:uncharacterized protein BcabD6B2_41430 [Babesia caballi]|uniref:Uncharacterized protein n=1 Tax=Babesia caballi TaxID=5871 RepID=A0AAV4LX17_BABCB|nr:hypothetical protein, conserved [Babesia caballi]